MKWLLVCVALNGCGLYQESQKSIAAFDAKGDCEAARTVAEKHSTGMEYYVCANEVQQGKQP